jgi:hypothetical protein
VACYRIGFWLIKTLFPQYAPLLHHLRDVNTRTLGLPLSWIYKILLRLPEQATQEELQAMFPAPDGFHPPDGFYPLDGLHPPDTARPLDAFFATHRPPPDGLYPIRGVVLFGLAECERGRLFAEALKSKSSDTIGRLMNVSHDGDRVVRFSPDGQRLPYQSPTSNGYLLDLIEDLESGDPERVLGAQLQWQPGGYGCSIPEIDLMVDVSLRTEGVIGAQLAGAGLGGCMMVLARKDALPRLIGNLTEQYYHPYGKEPAIMVCKPIAGSGVLLMNGG